MAVGCGVSGTSVSMITYEAGAEDLLPATGLPGMIPGLIMKIAAAPMAMMKIIAIDAKRIFPEMTGAREIFSSPVLSGAVPKGVPH
jgi:hypothetical protein